MLERDEQVFIELCVNHVALLFALLIEIVDLLIEVEPVAFLHGWVSEIVDEREQRLEALVLFPGKYHDDLHVRHGLEDSLFVSK